MRRSDTWVFVDAATGKLRAIPDDVAGKFTLVPEGEESGAVAFALGGIFGWAAVAADNLGATTTSAPVHVTVAANEAPTVAISVTTTDGTKKFIPYAKGVNYISYRDGYGNLVSGYSIDGRTWVQATGGTLPVLELNGRVNWTQAADGSIEVTDGAQNVIFTSGPGGVGWKPGAGLDKAGQAGAIGWFGQANLASSGISREGVGAPGQQFRIVTAVPGPDGAPALNLVPREILYTEITAANVAARVTKVQKAGVAPGAAPAEESAAIRARGLTGTPIRSSAGLMAGRSSPSERFTRRAKPLLLNVPPSQQVPSPRSVARRIARSMRKP